MTNLSFKVETKNTVWHITVSHGEYSDYTEHHFFISANDRAEAIFAFKQYIVQNPVSYITEYDFDGDLFLLGRDATKPRYGWDKADVELEMLPVIYFR
jgi:hypothetical protein